MNFQIKFKLRNKLMKFNSLESGKALFRIGTYNLRNTTGIII